MEGSKEKITNKNRLKRPSIDTACALCGEEDENLHQAFFCCCKVSHLVDQDYHGAVYGTNYTSFTAWRLT